MGQEEADMDVSSLDNRKNLRERVAKLEALVEALSKDKSEPQGTRRPVVSRVEALPHSDTRTTCKSSYYLLMQLLRHPAY